MTSFSSHSTKSPKKALDFDEDDPLGDLLSSSGENTPNRKTSKQSGLKDNDSKNLFDRNENKETNYSAAPTLSTKSAKKGDNPADWLGLKSDGEPGHSLKRELSSPKSKNHLLSESRANIKEDELSSWAHLDKYQSVNFTRTQSVTSSDGLTNNISREVPKDQKKTTAILRSFITDFDSKYNTPMESQLPKNQSTDELTGGAKMYTPSVNSESRRSMRRRAGELADPLGLFSSLKADKSETNKEEINNEKIKMETVSNVAGKSVQEVKPDPTPQWLGGFQNKSEISVQQESISHNDPSNNNNNNSQGQESKSATQNDDDDIIAQLVSLETKVGEAATQQQKSFISALALKRQEDILLRLQGQHVALLAQHEQQLRGLVHRQVERQQQMIKQQEQIQAHIQALIAQPPVMSPVTLPPPLLTCGDETDFNSNLGAIGKAANDERENQMISDLKNQIRRLEKENQELTAQVETERARYEKYLAEMETLFRRQLSIQEDTILKQEKRFSTEKEVMEKDTQSRINRLKEEHEESSQQQVQRMAQLHNEWLSDLQRLGEFHKQAIEMLRSEQTSSLEHWKNLQITEIEATKDASSNARLLEVAVNHLQESTLRLKELKDQLSEKSEKQELHMSVLREALEKQFAALDTEKSCLSKMSHDFELRLLKQEDNLVKEKDRFEARQKAWEKEKLEALELLKQEKSQLEKLQRETQAELADLGRRKLALSEDIARLETSLQIQKANANQNSEQAEEMVAEARSTLEAAQEAGLEVQREREEMMVLKSRLNAQQKHLESFERQLKAREQKIEEEVARAKAYMEEGSSALDEARRLERERTEHASDLTQRLLHLKDREDSLAEEKLALTMEWKRIQESRDSSICFKCGQVDAKLIPTLGQTRNIVDPLPIIMKLKAEQEMDLEFLSLDHPKYHSSLLDSVSK